MRTKLKNIPPAKWEQRLFSLKVTLIAGPVTYEFAHDNPEVSRNIEITGNQTLKDLHTAIFYAFNRNTEREYEFQVDGKEYSPEKKCFLPVQECRDIFGMLIQAGDAGKTSLEQLNLLPGDIFYYWFDFSNDWMHRILVISIGEASHGCDYPLITDKVGDSPPQRPDWNRIIRV